MKDTQFGLWPQFGGHSEGLDIWAGSVSRNEASSNSMGISTFEELDQQQQVTRSLMVRVGNLLRRTESSTIQQCADSLALCLCPVGKERGQWGTHYAPLFSGTIELTEINSKVIASWEARAQSAQQPTLRHHYADLVWEFGRKVTGQKPAIRFAHISIDAAIELTESNACGESAENRAIVERAVRFAMTIGDDGRLQKAISACLLLSKREPNTRCWAFRLLVEDELTESETVIAEALANLEEQLREVASHPEPNGVADPALVLARYYRRADDGENLKRVIDAYRTAFINACKTTAAMVARAWLDRVHAVLLEFKFVAWANELEQLMFEYGKKSNDEYARIEFQITIPKTEVDRVIAAICAVDETALPVFASEFLPTRKAAEEQLALSLEASPVARLIPLRQNDTTGRAVSEIGTIDSDNEGHVINEVKTSVLHEGPRLALVLDGVRNQINTVTIMRAARASWAFTQDDLGLLEAAVGHHEKAEYPAAIHLLIPRIEAAIRTLARGIGCEVLVLKPRTGLQELRLLNDLLRDDKLTAWLGADASLYLQTMLIEKVGLNLRNDVAHGLRPSDNFTRTISDRVLHILVLLLTRTDPSTKPNAG